MSAIAQASSRVLVPATAVLPYRPESAARARRLVRGKLVDWELEGLIDDAQLIVSELVGNAVRTGCLTHMTVRIRRVTAGIVRISVRDGSRTMPVLIAAGVDEECHRGLALIHRLTRGQWGVTADEFGKTVHADLRVPAG
ncbi:ATP-binding protein [Streptomyces sp. NRRL WC-3742]|uniref:ATP-binding protein n=1 Tax=Streptomyces sp. NRRL WC-3742 TaxID=1463934 RepID=UPI00068EE4FF|nr:ATP-binding protein [Streptomyces sp. NRRL WC-3742]